MIYIVTLCVCMYCSIHFDVFNNKNKRKTAYNGLLIWFIAISGLQYKMGTDMVTYMDWYADLDLQNWSIKNLISDNERYQPGWTALGYICKFITNDFLLLKILQSIFVNVAVFSYFKRETKYVFISVLLYGLMSYFVINFNILRQSIAIGFALYGLTYLRLKNYKKYYLFVLLAYLFHNSAFILIPLPLLNLLNSSKRDKSKKKKHKKGILLALCIFIAIIYVLSVWDIENLLLNILSSGYLGENITGAGLNYIEGDRLGIRSNFAVFSIQRILMIVAVIYYMKRYNKPLYGTLGLIYILIHILTGFLPILWRFRLYFEFPYYIILAQLFVEFVRFRKRFSSIALSAIIILVLYFPFRDYLAYYEGSKYRYIDQYYPYHSVFDMEHDESKQRFFDTLKQ